MKGKASKLQVLIGIFIMFVSAFVSTPRSVGQTVNGNILGTIRDPQGAVVPNATVSAKNLGTGEERTAISGASGGFSIVSIPAGSYVVTASATGFQTEVRSGITLTVGAALRVDFTLNVGAVSEKVVVTGEAPQVDTTTSTMAGLVNDTVIRELPLNGRDWLQLAALQAGVQQVVTQTTFDKGVTYGMGMRMSISGGRPSHNVYRIDGLVVNDYTNNSPGGALGGNMGVDSISEFSVLTNTYSAEYGRSSGGVVNAITKSGTNQLHGTAFYFGRNSALDARNFFDTSKAPNPSPVPPFRRLQFGGSLGGPIKKDKLFYFANYEGLRQLLNGSGSSFTLSPAARNGTICVGPSIANCPTTQVVIDPRVKAYLPLFPNPNSSIAGDTGLFVFGAPQLGNENYVSGRVDYLLNSRTTLSGGYTFDNTKITTADAFNEKLVATRSRNQRVVMSVQHIFSAAVLNTTRGGFSRTAAAASLDTSPATPLLSDLALGFVPGRNVGTVIVPGLASFGGIGSTGSDIFFYTAPQLGNDLVWEKGRNNIRIGFSIEDIRDNVTGNNLPAGAWQFGSILNFLTVLPQQFASDFPGTDAYRGLRDKIFGFYFQDDLRLRPNLTVNLGLRWEPATSISEVNGKAASLLNLADSAPHTGNPVYNTPTKRAFEPRVGLAWDPSGAGKTAIRAGFGFYGVPPVPNVLNNKIDRSAPFFKQGILQAPPSSSFPNQAFVLLNPTSLRVTSIEQSPRLSYKMQWNFNIQDQVSKSLAITAGYVGSRGVHLPLNLDDMDQVPPSLVTTAPDGHLLFPTTGTIPRINPNWSRIPGLRWNGYSIYHGLQVNVTERMSHGFTLQGAYVWSKSIDIGSSEYTSGETTNSLDTPYAFKPNLQRGVSDFDIPQHMSFNFLWDAPQPKSLSLVPRFLLSGWQLGGIFTVQSGPPFSVRLATDQARTGSSGLGSSGAGQRPDFNPAPGCTPNATNPGNFQNYLKLTSNPSTSCLSFPALGSLGNLGRNTLRGPGLEDFDFSLFKQNNVIGEKLKIQFRAEFFNLLNRSNLKTAMTTVFNSSGQPVLASARLNSGTATTSRQIQFGMKIIW